MGVLEAHSERALLPSGGAVRIQVRGRPTGGGYGVFICGRESTLYTPTLPLFVYSWRCNRQECICEGACKWEERGNMQCPLVGSARCARYFLNLRQASSRITRVMV
jgi:hypothetical protein